MTKGERQRLLAHLEMTERWLADEVSGLSPAQEQFRPGEGTWSVTEVVEHLAIAEPQYWQWIQDSLKQPATGFKAGSTDDAVLWYGIDRTNRQRTAEARAAQGKYTNVKEPLEAFRKLRATMLEYARATDDDLRGRQFRDGNMDVYQWFVMISTHAQRHILQVREIKSNVKFPRK
jgi:hypothetical protein